jgi:hypothetical protein
MPDAHFLYLRKQVQLRLCCFRWQIGGFQLGQDMLLAANGNLALKDVALAHLDSVSGIRRRPKIGPPF